MRPLHRRYGDAVAVPTATDLLGMKTVGNDWSANGVIEPATRVGSVCQGRSPATLAV